ncbi:hypothetical protein APLC1_0585 [Limnospira platensis C1]|nr:hypothetical protein APLC1_0585 [Arthrospira platensis C1]
MIVVSDTSPLSGLAIAGYLGLLEQLYGRVLIPSGFGMNYSEGEKMTRASQMLWVLIGLRFANPLINNW